jgi:hypothetical protein
MEQLKMARITKGIVQLAIEEDEEEDGMNELLIDSSDTEDDTDLESSDTDTDTESD